MINDLQKIIEGDILNDEQTIKKYSKDYSIFKIIPKTIIYPKNKNDISNLIKYISKNKKREPNLSITARSAGTDMSGGPLNTSIILDFTKYFNKIIELNPQEQYVIIEPGLYFRDLEKELNNFNLFYPAYPASKDLCAIGGMISNNSGGEKSLKYGKTENYVLSLNVILADGQEYEFKSLNKKELMQKIKQNDFEGQIYKKIYNLINKNFDLIQKSKPKVSKNSTGYQIWNVYQKENEIFDLSKIFIGAQGTLGVITKAKLKLLQKPKYEKLIVAFINDINYSPKVVSEILKIQPESIESFDDQTLKISLKFLPKILKIMKGNIFSLFFKFIPEILMIASGGIPKMILLIELTSDNLNEINNKIHNLKNIFQKLNLKFRVIKNDLEASKYWTIRRLSFKLLHEAIKNKTAAPFIDDFVVNPENLSEILNEVNQILKKHQDKFIYTIAGHPGNGNFHIIPLVDLKDKQTRILIPEIMEKVYKKVVALNGSLSGEHNDGLIRTPYLNLMYKPEMIKIFEEIKKIFDYNNIFNPGKKVFWDKNFILNHIKQEND
ncbi:MAG: FAD-binding oxidoreductase [Patescibacteria group bacterium]|nr:FAD-binding oxidoreductase [Patescibacteria group bacterium]